MIPLHELRPYAADRERPSPNFSARPSGAAIRYIILHATAGSDEGAESWMADPISGVSAHLHIRRDGSITRHVDDAQKGWHAGVSSWEGRTDLNGESLGWEIGNRNDGAEPYTGAQYRAVARLLHHYLPQGLDRSAVLSHAQVAPGRKTDPMGWDWARMWAELDLLEREQLLGAIPHYTPQLAIPQRPLAPRAAPIRTEPIEIPKAVPVEIQQQPFPLRVWQLRKWAIEVAERIGAEARERRVSGADYLAETAVHRLYGVVAGVVPEWLLVWFWPAVEAASSKAIGSGDS